MIEYVNDAAARAAKQSGTHIGGIDPCSETKLCGWSVYSTGGEIIACVVDTNGSALCGERISESELPMYVDDVDQAIAALKIARGEQQ